MRIVLVVPLLVLTATRSASTQPASGLEVRVVDARTGNPLPGAKVVARLVAGGGTTACGPDDLADGIVHPTASVDVATDRAGIARFKPAQLAMLAPVVPHCPPGAPCVPPPVFTKELHVEAASYLPLRIRHLEAMTVRLVRTDAKVTTRARAIDKLRGDTKLARWLAGVEYKQIDACLDRTGAWNVSARSVSWVPSRPPIADKLGYAPSYLPPVHAQIDPFRETVRVRSCPVQGTPVSVAKDGVVDDWITGYRYRCAQQKPARCASSLATTPYPVSSYGAPVTLCGEIGAGPLTIALDAPTKAFSPICTFLECVRER